MVIQDPKPTQQYARASIEWPTMAVAALVYVGWLLLTSLHAQIPTAILIVGLSYLVALHSSLQHEVIHGHPTSNTLFNTALAFPALGLAVPYQRYEILHLQHHRNWLITDPYDDSESYFLARKHWLQCSAPVQALLRFNNTLLGRLLIGPAVMVIRMIISEAQACKANRDVLISWLWHALGVSLVLFWLWFVDFSIGFYCLTVAYPATSLLMLRAYGEHLPEVNIDHRSAIVKTNLAMQLLYLNNNYHRVHHDHPELAWYALPRVYRQHYAQQTIHVYRGYLSLIKRFALKQRFSVDHPFLARD